MRFSDSLSDWAQVCEPRIHVDKKVLLHTCVLAESITHDSQLIAEHLAPLISTEKSIRKQQHQTELEEER
jgi:hypothetical protein